MTHTPDDSGDHRGVRPTQALCEKCGYLFGGIEIQKGGVIVCPECAHVTRFALRAPRPRSARWAWLAAGVVLIMIWGALRLARGDDPWLVAAVTLGFSAALIVVVWTRAAAMGRRP